MKRKIAAIFAADIAGYSRLVAEDEEETLRRLASYRQVTDDFIARYGGRIFNTAGDAVLVCRISKRPSSGAMRDRYPGKPAHPEYGVPREPPHELSHRHHDRRRGGARW